MEQAQPAVGMEIDTDASATATAGTTGPYSASTSATSTTPSTTSVVKPPPPPHPLLTLQALTPSAATTTTTSSSATLPTPTVKVETAPGSATADDSEGAPHPFQARKERYDELCRSLNLDEETRRIGWSLLRRLSLRSGPQDEVGDPDPIPLYRLQEFSCMCYDDIRNDSCYACRRAHST